VLVKTSRIPVVAQFEFWEISLPLSMRHPERSRFSGGVRDLARSAALMQARSLGALVKTRVFGMTHPHSTAN
jgi:hypothetical protein